MFDSRIFSSHASGKPVLYRELPSYVQWPVLMSDMKGSQDNADK